MVCGLVSFAPAHAVQALKLNPGERIAVDGRIDEPAWQRAKALDRFWELFPQAEVEARLRTEARYMIVLFIDPVGNRKFAHFFRVNPRGAIGDGLYNEDSGAEDFSPDFDFEVATAPFEGGWAVEFRIPFSSLRYGDPPSRQWSTMVLRNYPRDQRYRFSTSKLPRDQNCFLCLNEPLTGLDALPDARHLAITPDLTVRSTTTPSTRSKASRVRGGYCCSARSR